MKKKLLIAGGMLLTVAVGAATAATLATQSTVTATITVPYTVGDQSGQVVVTKDIQVPTVTETVTVTTTTTPPPPTTTTTETTPPPPPPPPSGTKVDISPSSFQALLTAGASVSGYHVTGSVDVNAKNVTIDNCAFDGDVTFNPGSSGSAMRNSSSMGFNIFGADNITIDSDTFDGKGKRANNNIYDQPAGNTPDNWVIRNSSFTNFYVAGNTGSHSEALFIGYSSNGLVENNVFRNNGNTGHIFFTWWGTAAYQGASISQTTPHDICVRGNTFSNDNSVIFHYYDINIRGEINPTTSNLRVDPTSNKFDDGVANSKLLAAC